MIFRGKATDSRGPREPSVARAGEPEARVKRKIGIILSCSLIWKNVIFW